MSGKDESKESSLVDGFLEYVNKSPSPFHCVDTSIEMLRNAGYVAISEKNPEDWSSLEAGGKYYFTRNQSTIFAFSIGGKWVRGNGFSVAAAHTDSPVPKIKPISSRIETGYQSVGVELYGGGLWNTWFDRDLSVAGRVIVANDDRTKFDSKLCRINRPIMYIPNLAIHLNRGIYKDGFNPNKETEVMPVLATCMKAELEGLKSTDSDSHHPALLSIVAEELRCDVKNICDFELCLYDTNPSARGGALNEFIFSPRLDNQMSCYVLLKSLLAAEETSAEDPLVRVIALFDNEEIGSKSARGADSSMMVEVLQRINGSEHFESALRKSFLVSADMAHAIHPNYASKHEKKHRPAIHEGLVVKQNANQRYATTSVTSFILKELAKRHDLPLQFFVVRNDMGCGSTVGPMLSAHTGIRTVDVGIPQLAMHSVREMCGTKDVETTIDLMTAFFNEFAALDASITVDSKY